METTYQASHAGRDTFRKNAHMLLGKANNILLVKDDVGKPKPNTRNLPSKDFAFGKGNIYEESAAEGRAKPNQAISEL